MKYLDIDIGGRPGVDCRGFCEYCYFKRVKNPQAPGCRYCGPSRVGCTYCTTILQEGSSGFRPFFTVAVNAVLRYLSRDRTVTGLRITGGGDPSCYPKLRELIGLFGTAGIPSSIGYTSGKGFSDTATGRFLVKNGLSEIGFSLFSANPDLRRTYMHDPSPDVSLCVLEYFCRTIDVYAAAVVLPGINDGNDLKKTCEWLEERGAKGLILMRFANTEEQGLILGNSPVIREQRVQSVDEFRDLVADLSAQFTMKISGSPLQDMQFDSPFAIRNRPDLISRLPRIHKRATVISGSIAAPSVQQVLGACGFSSTVVATNKEIACLITLKDLQALPLSRLEKTIILPGRALVRDRDVESAFRADGVRRTVIRGPDLLTADAEKSMTMTRDDLENLEIQGFTQLISLINQYGV
jgi:methanogenesis marker radical SAM protein